MFRLLWAILLALGAVISSAAFDLQFVKKFNSSVIARSKFTHVVRSLDGGFFALGEAGTDILLVRFDQYGTITHTRVWDTPLVKSDYIIRVDRTNDNELAVVVGTNGGRYLVRFSEALIPVWTLEIPVTAICGTSGTGIACYAANTGTGTVTAQIVTNQGTLSGSVPIVADAVLDIQPCATSTNPGFILAGRKPNQGFVARITNSAQGIYTATTTASASTNNEVRRVAVDASGIVTGLGYLSDGTNIRLALFRVSASGALTSALRPVQNTLGAHKVEIASSTIARALVTFGSQNQVLEFNRTSFGIVRIYENPYLTDFAVQADANRLICPTDTGFLETFSIANGGQISYLTIRTMAATAIGSDEVAAVGEDDNRASVSWKKGTSLFDARFAFSGPTTRTIADSDLGDSGVIAFAESHSTLDGVEDTVVAYQSSGALAFAKGFFPANNASVSRVKVMSDGRVLAVGKVDGVLAATLYSSTGAVVFAKTYATAGVSNVQSLAFVGGAGFYVLGTSNVGIPSLLRVGGNGELFWARQIISGNAVASNMVVTVAGDLAFILRPSTGATIYLVDSGPGTTLQTTSISSAVVWDRAEVDTATNGEIIAMVTRIQEQTLVRRYNRTTLAQLAAYGDTAYTVAMDVGPNGRIALLQKEGGVAKIRQMPEDFSTNTSTNLEPNVTPMDVAVGPTGLVYIVGNEDNGDTTNAYAAKYLTNGVRSAVRRLSGNALETYAPSGATWVVGATPTRGKGIGPYAAKYSP